MSCTSECGFPDDAGGTRHHFRLWRGWRLPPIGQPGAVCNWRRWRRAADRATGSRLCGEHFHLRDVWFATHSVDQQDCFLQRCQADAAGRCERRNDGRRCWRPGRSGRVRNARARGIGKRRIPSCWTCCGCVPTFISSPLEPGRERDSRARTPSMRAISICLTKRRSCWVPRNSNRSSALLPGEKVDLVDREDQAIQRVRFRLRASALSIARQRSRFDGC